MIYGRCGSEIEIVRRGALDVQLLDELSDLMIRRQATCDRCGRAGVWLATTAGEVVLPDGSVAHAPDGVLLLLATADSPSVLACDDCVDGDGHLLQASAP